MIARLAVLALCFVAFAAYATHVTRAEVIPVRRPLSDLSMQLGDWSGRDAPKMTEDVLKVLGVDDYVSRYYMTSTRVVSLYVGYYESQRSGDTIHSPMNCLPGAGWQPVETGYVDVTIPEKTVPIRVKRVVIQKGLDRQVVLYWYQSHGRVIGNEYWSKVMMVYDAARLNRSDAALVRVISPIAFGEGDRREADESTQDFVRAMLPQLETHLPSS